jgi:hypothetical protein
VLVEVGKKLQQGEICRADPDNIFYDVLVGGKLMIGKFVLHNQNATHMEPGEVEWQKGQKVSLFRLD